MVDEKMQLTDATFSTEVEEFDGVVLVDFWADWCGPCKMIAPTVEELADEYKDNSNVKIMKLDVDNNPQTAQKFGVMSIPTLIVYKEGTPVGQIVGVQPKDVLQKGIENALEG